MNWSTKGFAVLVAMLLVATVAQADTSTNKFKFVVLSDTHIGQGTSSDNSDVMVAQEIAAMAVKPAAVFITGDAVNNGTIAQYTSLKNLIITPLQNAGIPVYITPGRLPGASEECASGTEGASGFG